MLWMLSSVERYLPSLGTWKTEVTLSAEKPYPCSQCGERYFTHNYNSWRNRHIAPTLVLIFYWKLVVCHFVYALISKWNQIGENLLKKYIYVLCFKIPRYELNLECVHFYVCFFFTLTLFFVGFLNWLLYVVNRVLYVLIGAGLKSECLRSLYHSGAVTQDRHRLTHASVCTFSFNIIILRNKWK